MTDTSNSSTTQYTYIVHPGLNLKTQVDHVVIALLPRGMLIAGFNAPGDILAAAYTAYNKAMPQWIYDFFEHRFTEEPLLSVPAKVKAIFVASEKYLLVPHELFDEQEASSWLKELFFVESNDTTDIYTLDSGEAHYVYAFPSGVRSLANRYFPQAAILPLSAYQFFKPFKSDIAIQCCITSETAVATLYNNKAILWHQTFGYDTAEDIAYQLRLALNQYRLDHEQASLTTFVVSKDQNKVLAELSQYFPQLQYRSNAINREDVQEWTPTISLIQQLFSCVS